MDIIVVAAISQNNVIGAEKDIPWRLSEDWKQFKKLTIGHPCVMGRKTYQSLPDNSKPLPGRENIILSSNPDYTEPGAVTLTSFPDAISYAENKKAEKLFIIGGATIYQKGIEVATSMVLTRVHMEVAGDVYFPKVNWDEWRLANESVIDDTDRVSGNKIRFSVQTHNRI